MAILLLQSIITYRYKLEHFLKCIIVLIGYGTFQVGKNFCFTSWQASVEVLPSNRFIPQKNVIMLKGPQVNCSIIALKAATLKVVPGISLLVILTHVKTVGATQNVPKRKNLPRREKLIEALKMYQRNTSCFTSTAVFKSI